MAHAVSRGQYQHLTVQRDILHGAKELLVYTTIYTLVNFLLISTVQNKEM